MYVRHFAFVRREKIKFSRVVSCNWPNERCQSIICLQKNLKPIVSEQKFTRHWLFTTLLQTVKISCSLVKRNTLLEPRDILLNGVKRTNNTILVGAQVLIDCCGYVCLVQERSLASFWPTNNLRNRNELSNPTKLISPILRNWISQGLYEIVIVIETSFQLAISV
jgi:hypothetical protein